MFAFYLKNVTRTYVRIHRERNIVSEHLLANGHRIYFIALRTFENEKNIWEDVSKERGREREKSI